MHEDLKMRHSRLAFIAFPRIHTLTTAMLLLIGPVLHAQQPPNPGWGPLRFLVGDWIGEGSGEPGKGSGSFSFAFDLQGTILVRKNHAEYPPAADRQAYSHDDVMVLYFNKDSLQALYLDNEGHVIHYAVEASGDADTVIFTSAPDPAVARYRLTYRRSASESLDLTFDIAPAGNPDAFRRYIQASAYRKN